jgi:hypothetical protein
MRNLALHSSRIDVGNNAINVDGLNVPSYPAGANQKVFSTLGGDCADYNYPSLQRLDLSDNVIGDCNQGTCGTTLSETMDSLSVITKFRTLDLTGNHFDPLIPWPTSWSDLGSKWPDIVELKAGDMFGGMMPFYVFGPDMDDCPQSMTTLHLMRGALQSEILLGPVSTDNVYSMLNTKFAPFEIAYDDRYRRPNPFSTDPDDVL